MQIVKEWNTIKVITESVVEYNIENLEAERASIIAQIEAEEPSDEELIELWKMSHPYYMGNSHLQYRLQEINNLLSAK